jgi:uncharacterized protein YndB with AHSA1/START domain
MTELASATRSLVVEREMPHPPAKIWRALTQGGRGTGLASTHAGFVADTIQVEPFRLT